MYKYETHMHTFPVSKCAIVTADEQLKFYKSIGFDGVFITNHFSLKQVGVDGATYEDVINNFFDDIKKTKKLGIEIGIKVFAGLELGDHGADFLVYGIGRDFFLQIPDFRNLDILEKLTMIKEAGGLIIHAHPFRQTQSKRALRIFPYHIEGVEAYNTNRENQGTDLAIMYAKHYKLPVFAGSDNHGGIIHPVLGCVKSKTPIIDETDFISKFRAGELEIHCEKNPFVEDADIEKTLT